MDFPVQLPEISGLKLALVAGLTLLTTDTLFAQSAGQSDLDALKARMDQMQKQYEQRIDKMDQERKQDKDQIARMESEIKALQSKAASGNSILNTRVLTDAEGKGTEATGPILDASFLKSLTRNFSFQIYMRAGVAFNGSGGGGNFNFEIPDGNGGRFRLGNENDFYMEVTFNQFHILGESPDMMDVTLRITPVFFNDITKITFDTTTNSGRDFNVGMREAFVEAKNVFKTAPEITFWGGQRFYDRQNIDPNDWYWLDSSGWGTGVKNISAGPGILAIAWLGGIEDNLHLNNASTNVINNVGNLFKQTFDIRYSDIDIGFGNLMLFGIGNYMKGGSYGVAGTDLAGNPVSGTVKTSDAYGIGGGVRWQYQFANKSYFRLAALFGYGATNFGSVTDPGTQEGLINNDWLNAVNRFEFLGQKGNVSNPTPGVFNVSVNPVSHASDYEAILEYVWNPTDRFSMDFWGYWVNDSQGFQALGNNAKGKLLIGNATRNLWGVGLRPVFWIADNIAIQGQAGMNYVDNDRGYTNGKFFGTNTFGRAGTIGIFTIAPTIKPKGGYFTRPEIRLFATYAIWSRSVKGATTPIGEGGNTGPSSPPYNGNTNQGWLFGSQAEIWF